MNTFMQGLIVRNPPRTYIPKADGRMPPLGIAALEDKIVQHALVQVLHAIYEADFLGFSYGFRPGRSRHARGDVIIDRYADDFVLGFQHRSEAERFLAALRERLEHFGLSLHPDKTRLIEFGPTAAPKRKRLGQGRPETFDFLGFTHI